MIAWPGRTAKRQSRVHHLPKGLVFNQALRRRVRSDFASPRACPCCRLNSRQFLHQRRGLSCPVGLLQRVQVATGISESKRDTCGSVC